MLKKEHRLSIKGKLKTIKTIHTPYFILKTAKSENGVKFGIIVGKKVDKRAVVRNRIKRQLNEAISKCIPWVIPGNDFLIIVKKEALQKETEKLTTELKKVLSKEGYLNEENFD